MGERRGTTVDIRGTELAARGTDAAAGATTWGRGDEGTVEVGVEAFVDAWGNGWLGFNGGKVE